MRPHHRAEFRREDRGRRASRCADQPDRDRGLSRRESRARSGGQGMSSQLTSAPLLAVRGLKLGYDRTDAVKGIDFDVLQGSVVTLIGANGAGKTTTLRGLSGLIKPRDGSIRFDDQELAGMAAHRIARLGVVQAPEGRQVFTEMTIAENLAMGAYLEKDAAAVARRRDNVLSRFPRLRERLTQLAGQLTQLLDGNNARDHPTSRDIAQAPHDAFA